MLHRVPRFVRGHCRGRHIAPGIYIRAEIDRFLPNAVGIRAFHFVFCIADDAIAVVGPVIEIARQIDSGGAWRGALKEDAAIGLFGDEIAALLRIVGQGGSGAKGEEKNRTRHNGGAEMAVEE